MNCRNCGMPLTGPKCEYCGTDYSAEMEAKKPRIVWDENGITLFCDDGMPLPKVTLTSDGLSAPQMTSDDLPPMWRWGI